MLGFEEGVADNRLPVAAKDNAAIARSFFMMAVQTSCGGKSYIALLKVSRKTNQPAINLSRRECGAFAFYQIGFFKKVIVSAHVGRDLAGVDVQHLRREVADEMHVVGNEH